ncbi:MAG: glycosyltransferase family 4 protein, partial [Vulcanimicrobiaceae bacterium]
TYAVRPLAERFFGTLQKRAYRAASMIVCISGYTQARLRSFEPDRPTVVIPNGVRMPVAEGWQQPKEPLLLGVGAFKERKGYRYVLEALPAIAQAVPSVRYIAVGDQRDTAYVRSLQEIVERLGLRQRVTFKEGISDTELDGLYRRARVFVLTPVSAPLNFEGFGLVYLEANARGVPVVGSFENGGDDAIADGRTGCLTRPRDPRHIAEKITRLLQLSDAAYAASSAECLAWARSHSWERTVEQYRDLYRRVIDQ